jgi:branched-chain amino acid transport system permease protein
MKAVVFQLATLSDVEWQASGEIVLMTIAGGIGTLTGPVVGAVLIVGMQNYMASLDEWVLIAQGVVLVLVVLLFQKGLVGTLASLLGRGR